MSKIKILLDPGHGAGREHNRGFRGGDNEGDANYNYCVGHLKPALERKGFIVEMTRKKITDDPTLAERGAMAAGYDLLFSSHSNAMPKPNTGTGTEIFDSVQKPTGSLAGTLSAEIAKTIGITNRGRKTRKDSDGTDWYGVLRNSKAKSAMLVEHFFHDNDKDVAKWWKTYKQVAERTADVLAAHYGLSKAKVYGTPIMGKPTVTLAQMEQWARDRKADPLFVELAKTFYAIAVKTGVDPAVIYAQSAKETGYMRFGGVLDKSFKNPCGLKTTKGGGNYDKNAHQRFASWEQGIQAQADHLALYAGAKGYPKAGTPDPRHFPSIKGKAVTVEQLGGNWAPSLHYGSDIVDRMKSMQATKVQEAPKPQPTQEPKKLIGVFPASAQDMGAAMRIIHQVTGAVLVDGSRVQPVYYSDIVQVGGSKQDVATVHIAGANRYETDAEVMKWISAHK